MARHPSSKGSDYGVETKTGFFCAGAYGLAAGFLQVYDSDFVDLCHESFVWGCDYDSDGLFVGDSRFFLTCAEQDVQELWRLSDCLASALNWHVGE